MKHLNLLLSLLHVYAVKCDVSSTTNSEDATKDSTEVTIPDNMNIADYYFSIFGKHLDYDYREPIFTFDEPVPNELSEEKVTDTNFIPHSRQKRFVLVPVSANVYNATRRWNQQMRTWRNERRRLRLNRRKQWQQNRINYLNSRSDSLQRQANRLKQAQTNLATRSVTEKPLRGSVVTTKSPPQSTTTHAGVLTAAASNIIPVKQVPIPDKSSVKQVPIPNKSPVKQVPIPNKS